MDPLYKLGTRQPSGYAYVSDQDRYSHSGKAKFFKVFKGGSPTGLLYKQLDPRNDHTPQMRRRAPLLMSHLESVQRLAPIYDWVPVLPQMVVEDDTGCFGFLIKDVSDSSGQRSSTLDQVTTPGDNWVAKQPLDHRFSLAIDIAQQITFLHGAGVLQSDLASANIVVQRRRGQIPKAYLIDLDSSAVVDSKGAYLPGLESTIRIQPDSVFPAPEIERQTSLTHTSFSTEYAERWSLAVAIHYILMDIQNPFSLYDTLGYQDILNTNIPWPPVGSKVTSKLSGVYYFGLYRLDAQIYGAFRDVFHRSSGHGFIRESRPSAAAWVGYLKEARRNLAVHTQCPNYYKGQDLHYVALGKRKCPRCHPEDYLVTVNKRGARFIRRDDPWPWVTP